MKPPRVRALALLPGDPPGGTRPRYFRCDDGHDYLVKFAESNVVKLAVNEWVGWALGAFLALPLFACAFVEIGQTLLDASPDLSQRLSKPGVHFGVRKASHYVLLRNLRVPHDLVENLPDVARSVAFDNWILNNDRAKPENIVLHRNPHGRSYRFVLTDHGEAFLGPQWDTERIRSRESITDPVSLDPWVAATVTSMESFEPTLGQIRIFPAEALADIVGQIPPEWLHMETEREALKYTIQRRRDVVTPMLELASRKGQFPRWRGPS